MGKVLRSNPQETIMASLIGSTSSYAISWANQNGLTATIETVSPGNEHFNSNYAAGIVSDQSIHIGTLINNYSSITFYVNSAYQEATNNNNYNNTTTTPSTGDTIIETNDEETDTTEKDVTEVSDDTKKEDTTTGDNKAEDTTNTGTN